MLYLPCDNLFTLSFQLDQQERDRQETARRMKEEATPPARRLPAAAL
jgi:hypothetical protein